MAHRSKLSQFFASNQKVARVRLTKVSGSSPRDEGTEMYVSANGLFGTIGGGRLEQMVIDDARELLARGDIRGVMAVPLGPEIGQCCGGHVTVQLTRMSKRDCEAAVKAEASFADELPCVYILGAGHVGRAMAEFFALLPVRTILVDSRADQLDMCTAPVDIRHRAIPEVDVFNAPSGSAFIVATHDHGLDFLLASAALERADASYVGLIGSKTKRAKFESWCRKMCDGLSAEDLVCPIGATASADKRPQVIASFVAAEVMAILSADECANTSGSREPIAELSKVANNLPGRSFDAAGTQLN
ncbi:MAG: xanthine dehydrogenase accessory protein XdhC [Rhizobiaceae bacterium]|nr:xanthine dehydrogenase accessory protein XdhC [Rhizobiaceae bacterium]